MDEPFFVNRSLSACMPCIELHYHGRIYLLDCGWDLSFLNVFLPPPAALRESKVVSPLDVPQLERPVVELNGGVFLNTDPFIIAYDLDRIDWPSIDAIFVSTVGSYMLLPIILRETEFSGAIYAPCPLCEIAASECKAVASTPSSRPVPENLTDLVRHLPAYSGDEYCGYPLFSPTDLERGEHSASLLPLVASLVTKVSYGETIERDRTVSVNCFFDGNGLTSCGWQFKPVVSKNPLHTDIVYFPSDQFITSLQTSPLQKNVLEHCSTLLFGSHPQLTEKERGDAILDAKELHQTIQRYHNENKVVLFLGTVDDVLVSVLTLLTKEAAAKGKLPLVCFTDEGENAFFQAVRRYAFHPECLSEELKRKIMGGIPPFAWLGGESDVVSVTASPSRLRNASFVLIPHPQFGASYPSSLLSNYEGCEVITLSPSCQHELLEPLLPDARRLHTAWLWGDLPEVVATLAATTISTTASTASTTSTSSTTSSTTTSTTSTTTTSTTSTMQTIRAWREKGRVAIACEANALVLMRMEQFSLKRPIDAGEGLKWLEKGSKALVLGGRAIPIGEDVPLEVVKKRATELGEVEVNGSVVGVPSVGVQLHVEGKRVIIEYSKEAKEEDKKRVAQLFS